MTKTKPRPRKRQSVASSNEAAPFSVRLSAETEALVRKTAKAEKRKMKAIIELAIEQYVARANQTSSIIR